MRVPLLEDSQVSAPPHRLAMARAMGRSARVATIAGAGHAAHREQPEAFLGLLQPWLAARR